MEPQQQQPANEQENNSCSSNNNRSSYVCRQTSTRWTPTSDQIRILKDLYYNHGVRSPSTEQIQRISARLRQYGKVEGKNVFYWFQNHKARERQKKRFIVESMAMQQRHPPPTVHHYGHHLAAASSSAAASWKPNPTIPGFSSPSSSCSAGNNVLGVGQAGNNAGYASLVMENSFRECSISSGGGSNVGQTVTGNFSWVENGVEPYPFLDKTRHVQFLREDYSSGVMETLPLFPMHGEDNGSLCSRNPYPDYHWFRPEDGMNGSQTSLELSLNPYGYGQ